MLSRHRETVCAALLALAVAVVLTWPLATQLTDGGRVDSGDGRYSIWNVAWVAHALTTDPARVYDANIFYPSPKALVFSEANLVAGVLAIPAWLISGGNPYAAYNTFVILAFALSGFCAFLLARHLGANRTGAAVAGLIAGYCPYMFAHLPHAQLLMTFGPTLSLLTMHRYVDHPSWRRAVALGLALTVTGLACAYYGIFSGLVVTMGVLWFARTDARWRQWRYWAGAATAAGIVSLCITPFFLPYLDVREAGFGRTLDDARLFSTIGRAYFASAMALHTWILPLLGSWREVLFPGFQAIILGLAAIVIGLRRPVLGRPAIIGFYAAVIVMSVWISLGPDAGLYTLLYHTLPAFSFLRAPARMGILVTLALAILTGLLVTWLTTRSPRRALLSVTLVAIALAESWLPEMPFVLAPPLPKAHVRLAALPWGPVVEFPFFIGPVERHRNTEYMLLSTFHWHPLLNGYSDHMPMDIFEVKTVMHAFPAPESLQEIRTRGIRWVAVHFNKYDAETRRRVRRELRQIVQRGDVLRVAVDDSEVSLYEVIWPTRAAGQPQP
jgi:hypothetical protein